jgi:hypothetical protein
VEIYLKNYLLFVARKHKEVATFASLKAFLTASRSGDGGSSQFEFIELFLLGKFTVQRQRSTQLVPPMGTNRGDLLSHVERSRMFDSSFFAGSRNPQEGLLEEAVEFLYPPPSISIDDGGRETRSRAPFLPPPAPHHYDKDGFEARLSLEEKELVSLIRNQTLVCQVCNTLFASLTTPL